MTKLEQSVMSGYWSSYDPGALLTAAASATDKTAKLVDSVKNIFDSDKKTELGVFGVQSKVTNETNAFNSALVALSSKPDQNNTVLIAMAFIALLVVGILVYVMFKK